MDPAEDRSEGRFAVPQVGSRGGHTYAIDRADGGWHVVHTDPKGKAATLTPKPVSYAEAYRVALDAARKAVA